MIAAIKAELRKLLSIRSTYYLLGFVLILVIVVAFYGNGWRINKMDLMNPGTLAGDITGTIGAISVFPALIGMLLVTHEYRYNTIMYTLTSSNSRNKILAAKVLVVSGLAIIFTLFFGVISPLITLLGIHAHHLTLVHQTISYGSLIWHCLFYGWGYVMAGLVMAVLIRNQVGALITLLIAPVTIEGLLGLLLNKKVVYLPFTALHQVIGLHGDTNASISPPRAVLVFSIYLLVSWIVAWALFQRRDAN